MSTEIVSTSMLRLPTQYKAIVLNSRPLANIEPDTFRLETRPLSQLEPSNGQALVQCTWMPLGPGMREFIKEEGVTFLQPVGIGEVMRSVETLGVVVEVGPGSTFKVGDHVIGSFGMTEYALMTDEQMVKLIASPGVDFLDYTHVLGTSGFSAYFGLQKFGNLKAGQTLVVSSAAGSVGSIACQLGKAAGARVYGITGSDNKCAWVEKELGVEKAFNYKSSTFQKDITSIGPIDVYFDNVGGEMLDFLLTRLNDNARVIICGAVSSYNQTEQTGLHNYLHLLFHSASMHGLRVWDYISEYPAAIEELSGMIRSGALKARYHIVEGGIEQVPAGLEMLFDGKNTGKLIVKVSEERKLA